MKKRVKNNNNTVLYFLFLTLILGGLTVGDPVLRSGKPLSVELGPGKVTWKKDTRDLIIIMFRSYVKHL